MMSPGSRVMILEMNRTRNGTGKMRLAVFPDCLSFPFRKVLTWSADGSMSVATHGPTAAKVSKDFARVNWTSLAWRSRAVTSLKQV